MRERVNIKIFQTLQSHMEIGGIIRDQGAFNDAQMRRILLAIICLILQCVYLLHVANTPRQYLDSIFMTTAGFLIAISYVSIVSKSTELFNFINDVEKIINERLKYPKSMEMYKATNKLVEMLSKTIQFAVVYASVPSFVLPKAIYSFFIYFTTKNGAEAFELPFPTWIPFDWKNPIGYLIAVTLQFIIVAFTLQYFSIMMSLAIGSYLFSMPLIKDIKEMIHSYNDSLKIKPTRTEMKKKLSEIIRYTQFKQTFLDFMDINQITMVVLFLGCTGAIGLALMMIQQQLDQIHNEIDSIVLFESIFCGFWSIVLVFIACEFMQRVSNTYDAIGDAINDTDWYLVPHEMQMHPIFLISLMYAQKPLECQFFGSISCSREQFKGVIHKGYNGFMVLRSLYK